MSLRETLNNNPAVVTGGAAVLLLVAAFFLVRALFFGGSSAAAGTEQVIYYDVANKTIKLVERQAKDVYPNSPLDGSPDTYQATIFACGECGEITDGMTADQLKAANMFVGYLHKRDPGSEYAPEFNPSYMYRPFESKNWYPAGEQWYRIDEQIQRRCPGNTYATYCYAMYK